MTIATRLGHCTTMLGGHSPACDRDGHYCALASTHDGPCRPHGASHVSQEAVCANCGDQTIVPWDEDPDDTLCVACAEEEQGQ